MRIRSDAIPAPRMNRASSRIKKDPARGYALNWGSLLEFHLSPLDRADADSVLFRGLPVAQLPGFNRPNRRLGRLPFLSVGFNRTVPKAFAFFLRPDHPGSDPFTDGIELEFRQAGQQVQQQSTNGGRGVKAFLST